MKEKGHILIVEDEQDMLLGLQKILSNQGHNVDIAGSGSAGLERIQESDFDIVVTDLKMPDVDGMELLRKVKEIHSDTMVIVITGYGTVENAVEAMKRGAYDYITKPFDAEHIMMVVRKALKQISLTNENRYLKRQIKDAKDFQNIIGNSCKMQDVFEVADKVARTDATVLLLGESGTGKELIARYIHYNSERKNGVFIPVNCGALTETLLESELFGHEKGAFTGAISSKRGLIEIASGGTFFFDEIGDVSLVVQGKLLRVLQEREFMRVGGTDTIAADIRLIAATNKDLEKCLKERTFREDLYYRLNVVAIRLPTLRERKDDILPLAQFFLRRSSKKMGKNIREIPQDVLEVLLGYDWPGNVRELENVIERVVVLATEDTKIQLSHLPDKLLEAHIDGGILPRGLSYSEAKQQVVDSFNREFLERLLQMNQGNISQAAKQAKMDGANFRRLMRKCGFQAEEHKQKRPCQK
ncbi:MAG: sigma-54-dependent Fis family transcriptional regulator [Candidatus Bathyarchaeota archaeon]|nr:MAG: sigma-54-dependent Fis family transcriptional regulator [Candidatus Bathyarchaeota archaeon]